MSRSPSTAIPDQTGRTIVVTGANAGLGLETTRALAAAGAYVILACRNVTKATAAVDHLRSSLPDASLEVRQLDLADLASVQAFAEGLRADLDHLDVLVNNAGLMATDEARTADGFELQLGVNHLGHFALTAALLPLLEAAPAGRVVTVASMGHRMGWLHREDLQHERRYRRWSAYFQSKLANLLFTAELHRRLTEAGASTRAVAAHPGAARTDLGTEGHGVSNLLLRPVVPLVSHSAETGALSIVRAATDAGVPAGGFVGPRFVARGRPRLETPSRRARDADDARWLWERSVELTGVEPLVEPRLEAGSAAGQGPDLGAEVSPSR